MSAPDQPALLDLGPAAPVAQHTPGPWIADDDIITDERGYMVAEVHERSGRPENKANARLIAAAPDLLEALRDVSAYLAGFMNEYPHGNGPVVCLAMARAAIAKAEGRS